jgi:hypothetical protein
MMTMLRRCLSFQAGISLMAGSSSGIHGVSSMLMEDKGGSVRTSGGRSSTHSSHWPLTSVIRYFPSVSLELNP